MTLHEAGRLAAAGPATTRRPAFNRRHAVLSSSHDMPSRFPATTRRPAFQQRSHGREPWQAHREWPPLQAHRERPSLAVAS
eukprot:354906-Chlamydomonas_euryale.AAC.4